MRNRYTKELLEPIVKRNTSLKGVIEELRIGYINGITVSISKAIKRNNICTDHFIGKSVKTYTIRKNEEIFTNNNIIGRTVVRNRIIKDNLIPYICSVCGCNDDWMGKKMPLILDHIDGINENHELENLRFLCSNCDSIQDTYKSKNKNTSIGKERIKNNMEKLNEKHELKEQKKQKAIIQHQIILDNLISNNINFNKSGWGVDISNITGWTPQYSRTFIKKFFPDIWNICWKHK